MTTKEYLGQIRFIGKRIQDKLAEAAMWREIALGSKKSNGSEDTGDRVQTSKHYDKLGDAVTIYTDLENESALEAKRLAILKYKISKEIDDLPNEIHYKILKEYYVFGKDARDIMDDIGYGKSRYYDYYESALNAFEEKYGSEYLKIG